MTNFPACIVLASFLISTCHCATLPPVQQAEQALVALLLSGYDSEIRPGGQVSVEISASLQQIVSLDEKQQIMTSSSFITQKWIDQRLSWTPNGNYSSIKVVMLSVSSLWKPDIMILNSADSDGYLTVSSSSLASVNNDGESYADLTCVGSEN